MTFLSKFNYVFSGGLGGCIGGLTVYALIGSKKDEEISISLKDASDLKPHQKWDDNWDKRDPTSLVKPIRRIDDVVSQNEYNKRIEKYKPKATRNILLIRHGQYNLEGKTDKERTLTKLGELQASLTGQRLKELGYPYTKMVQSTMTRATQTATFINKHLTDIPLKSCSMIEEGAPVEPEPPIGSWKPELRQFFQDGARIEAAFRKYIHRASSDQEDDTFEVIVCHGNVIRYFVCRALQIPSNAWLRFSINHGSITWLVIRPSGRVSLKSFSDIGYMPADVISS